jgi:methionyl aminopeptidase
MAIETPKRKTGLVLKSRREIGLMRDACQVVAEAHQLIARLLEPGITTGELDTAVEKLFEQRNAIPLFKGFPGEVPFPAVTCISVNEEVVHGIPGERVLREGDIISVDTGCKVRGWCGDGAWTYPVGEVSDEVRRLLDVGQRTLEIAIQGMARRSRWSEVARMMERHVDRSGFSPVLDFVGHGIGREMHEEPEVPNYVPEDISERDFPIKVGLVLAIEPMVNMGTEQVEILDDHWTVVTADGLPSVHFEHTVAMTPDGPQVLTEGIGAGIE